MYLVYTYLPLRKSRRYHSIPSLHTKGQHNLPPSAPNAIFLTGKKMGVAACTTFAKCHHRNPVQIAFSDPEDFYDSDIEVEACNPRSLPCEQALLDSAEKNRCRPNIFAFPRCVVPLVDWKKRPCFPASRSASASSTTYGPMEDTTLSWLTSNSWVNSSMLTLPLYANWHLRPVTLKERLHRLPLPIRPRNQSRSLYTSPGIRCLTLLPPRTVAALYRFRLARSTTQRPSLLASMPHMSGIAFARLRTELAPLARLFHGTALDLYRKVYKSLTDFYDEVETGIARSNRNYKFFSETNLTRGLRRQAERLAVAVRDSLDPRDWDGACPARVDLLLCRYANGKGMNKTERDIPAEITPFPAAGSGQYPQPKGGRQCPSAWGRKAPQSQEPTTTFLLHLRLRRKRCQPLNPKKSDTHLTAMEEPMSDTP